MDPIHLHLAASAVGVIVMVYFAIWAYQNSQTCICGYEQDDGEGRCSICRRRLTDEQP